MLISSAPTTHLLLAITSSGRPQELLHLLTGLRNQYDQDFAVIVLNDGGNHTTQAAVSDFASYHPDSIYLETPAPSGLPKARNIVLESVIPNLPSTRETFIAFLDDDIRIDRWFTTQLRYWSTHFDGFCFRLIQRGPAPTIDLTSWPGLYRLLTPFIGHYQPRTSSLFGGFYIPLTHVRRVHHLNGGCLVYNLSHNRQQRFDENLNQGTYILEDTDFSYRLYCQGQRLGYVGTYAYEHRPALEGGCPRLPLADRFYWYWRHKHYLMKKFAPARYWPLGYAATFLESAVLSIITRHNVVRSWQKSFTSSGTPATSMTRPVFSRQRQQAHQLPIRKRR